MLSIGEIVAQPPLPRECSIPDITCLAPLYNWNSWILSVKPTASEDSVLRPEAGGRDD